MKRVLITGGNGFIGSAIAQYLSQHFDVTIAVRSLKKSSQFEQIEIDDIEKVVDWKELLVGFDIVIHCAAIADSMNSSNYEENIFAVNTNATEAIAKAANEVGVEKFIFFSSIKVNGESTTNRGAFSVDELPSPKNLYGLSKLKAEKAIMKFTNMDILIIRCPMIYGPCSKGNFDGLIRLISKTRMNIFSGIRKNKRSILSIFNLTDFVYFCIKNNVNGIHLVSEMPAISTSQMTRYIMESLNNSVLALPLPRLFFKIGAFVFGKTKQIDRVLGDLEVQNSLKDKELVWTPPYSTKESVRMTVKSFEEKA